MLQLQEFVVSLTFTTNITPSVFGIGQGCERLEEIRNQAWVNEYIIDAELGKEKLDNQISGKVTKEAVYGN